MQKQLSTAGIPEILLQHVLISRHKLLVCMVLLSWRANREEGSVAFTQLRVVAEAEEEDEAVLKVAGMDEDAVVQVDAMADASLDVGINAP